MQSQEQEAASSPSSLNQSKSRINGEDQSQPIDPRRNLKGLSPAWQGRRNSQHRSQKILQSDDDDEQPMITTLNREDTNEFLEDEPGGADDDNSGDELGPVSAKRRAAWIFESEEQEELPLLPKPDTGHSLLGHSGT